MCLPNGGNHNPEPAAFVATRDRDMAVLGKKHGLSRFQRISMEGGMGGPSEMHACGQGGSNSGINGLANEPCLLDAMQRLVATTSETLAGARCVVVTLHV